MKRDPLRIRLANTKTVADLEKMISDIEADPDSRIGAISPKIYNRSALKKLDEISWAIYSITKKKKPEYFRSASEPEIKNW